MYSLETNLIRYSFVAKSEFLLIDVPIFAKNLITHLGWNISEKNLYLPYCIEKNTIIKSHFLKESNYFI